jgi:NADH-quinone oxidoreductase subunit A
MAQYLPILAMIVLVVLFVLLSFAVSILLGVRRPTRAKTMPYECGIVPEREPVERFPVKFYLVALTFIVLDVEIIFLYPFATVFRSLGGYGLAVMGVFLLVLIVPFAYLLSVGAIEWGPVRQVASRIVHRASGPARRGHARRRGRGAGGTGDRDRGRVTPRCS